MAGKGHGRVLRVRVGAGVEAGGGVGAVAAERGGGGARGRLPGLALAHGRLPGQAASSVSDGCHIPQQHLQLLEGVPALQPGLEARHWLVAQGDVALQSLHTRGMGSRETPELISVSML